MSLVAEFVSKGHPDRICDAIVNNIVNYVVLKDKDALCGLECAVHRNKVFIDGRIAAGKKETVIDINTIKEIVKKVYESAGYGAIYNGKRSRHPFPEELEIITDLCIETLSDDERDLREYSDDQNVVNGYAFNNSDTDYLPVEHYVALKIGEELQGFLDGPDFKVLVQISKSNNNYNWERLTLSIQHDRSKEYEKLFEECKESIDKVLKKLFSNNSLSNLAKISNDKFYLNGAGDFIQGGPEGDNGLSGKKLCVDFYGPSIPIGGGAIFGKDPHKIDVCGPFRAREVAVNLVKIMGFCSVFVTLAWSPGEKTPYLIEAYEIDEFGTKCKISDSLLPPKDYFSINCINNDLRLNERKITSINDIK